MQYRFTFIMFELGCCSKWVCTHRYKIRSDLTFKVNNAR
jgi:hypothetical protein